MRVVMTRTLVMVVERAGKDYNVCLYREGVLCWMWNAEIWKGIFCRISPVEHSASYTLEFFPHSANNQPHVGLGLHLSLESTLAHHKWRGHAVGKVITYW